MLEALQQAGPSGLGTNEMSMKVFHSRSYGWKTIKQAYERGYIERVETPMPDGIGGPPRTMNKLTPAGRKLLEELRQ